MVKKLSILGSTGSIGKQALEVARKLSIDVVALAAHSNIKLLEEQIREFRPSVVAVYNEELANELSMSIKDLPIKVLGGPDGICELAMNEKPDIVLNAIVGIAGLMPTMCALKAKKHIALANKETLVAGGNIVMEEAKKQGVNILPVDSEHSAIFQCIQGMHNFKELKKIILTASGGPFFGKSINELKYVTPRQALRHPNWNMGSKITIDSATMMNKGLELIEASWLFNMDYKNIDIVIHKESVVHSFIEYIDNSVIAQMGLPDMKIPIQYSLTYPERFESTVNELDLTKYGSLTFCKPDYKTFKCLNACMLAMAKGGASCAVANGANEEAVKLFLKNKISFTDIGDLVYEVVDRYNNIDINSIENIFEADKFSREYVIKATI